LYSSSGMGASTRAALVAASNTVGINARCSLRVEADQCVIIVGRLPGHHCRAEDAVGVSAKAIRKLVGGLRWPEPRRPACQAMMRMAPRYQPRTA
jgi:hypothetical protein